MTDTIIQDEAVDRFAAQVERLIRGTSHDSPEIKARRERALQCFRELGFPTRRDEAWKYTSVNEIKKLELPLSDGGSAEEAAAVLSRYTYWESSTARIVFVDGRFSAELSNLEQLPKGLKIDARHDLAVRNAARLDHLESLFVERIDDGFQALNAALAVDGAVIELAPGHEIQAPIHVLYLNGSESRPFMAHPRNLIVVGENSELNIVERYVGVEEDRTYLMNGATEFHLGKGSRVRHYLIQRESETAFHVNAARAHLEQAASLRSLSVGVGGRIGRREFRMEQGGPGTECELDGLYFADKKRVADQYVVAHHSQDHSRSEQFYKGIMDDSGVGIFNGAIVADEHVRGTDAHQTNKNLLLSDDADAHTRPQLEIYCDDIACSHGATVGQLEESPLFYLMSRGIDEEQARAILTRAFAGDVIEKIEIEPIRERLEEFLKNRVSWGSIKGRELKS